MDPLDLLATVSYLERREKEDKEDIRCLTKRVGGITDLYGRQIRHLERQVEELQARLAELSAEGKR